MATYNREQTEFWLAWLAGHLRRRGRTIFLLERLDESWLGSRGQRWAYLSMFSVLFALSVGTVLSAFAKLSKALDDAGVVYTIDFWFWWLAAVLWALAAGVLTWFRPGWLPSARLRRKLGRRLLMAMDVVAYWVVWLAFWLLIWLAVQGCFDWSRSLAGLGQPLLLGLLLAVVYGLRYGLENVEGRVPTVEALGWSWRSALSGLAGGLGIGLVLWVVYSGTSLAVGTDWGELPRNLGVYLPVGGMGGFLFWGLRMRIVKKTRPNEGIRRSFANALLAGALCAAGIALVCWPVFVYVLKDHPKISSGIGALAFGTLSGTIAALWFGGLDFLRHWMLRLALSRTAPRRWIGFLEYAVELGLLRRVGGGYMFIHRFVLDHFADRALPKPE